MERFLIDLKFYVNVEQHSHIGYKYVFHVEALVRFVLVPYKVSDEPLHYESSLAYLLQKVTLLSPGVRLVLRQLGV